MAGKSKAKAMHVTFDGSLGILDPNLRPISAVPQAQTYSASLPHFHAPHVRRELALHNSAAMTTPNRPDGDTKAFSSQRPQETEANTLPGPEKSLSAERRDVPSQAKGTHAPYARGQVAFVGAEQYVRPIITSPSLPSHAESNQQGRHDKDREKDGEGQPPYAGVSIPCGPQEIDDALLSRLECECHGSGLSLLEGAHLVTVS